MPLREQAQGRAEEPAGEQVEEPARGRPRPRGRAAAAGPLLAPIHRGKSTSGLLPGAARVGVACAILDSSASFILTSGGFAGVSISPRESGAAYPLHFGRAFPHGAMGDTAARCTRTSARCIFFATIVTCFETFPTARREIPRKAATVDVDGADGADGAGGADADGAGE